VTNGRIKGKAAERDVARIHEAWWAPFEPGTKFVRTPMSGGWSHGDAMKDAFQTAADLMTTSKIFPFSVEIKRREGWSWERFRDGKPSPVTGWWSQTRSEARANNRVPALWIRKSRMPWYVVLPEAFIISCWDRERASARKLPPVLWSFRWNETLVFEASVLLKHPPDYFIPNAVAA